MDFSLFKKHPAILIGVAIVGAYIFYELALSGGSSAPVVDNGQAQYAAQVGGTIAGLQQQAQSNTDNLNAALAGQAADNATKIQLAQIAAQTSTTQQGVAVGGTLDLASITGSIQEWLAGNQSTTQIALNKDNNATSIVNNTLAANTQTQLAQIGSATTLSYADIASKTSLGLGQLQAGTTVALAQIQGDVTNHQIDANSAVTQQAIKSRASDNTTSGILHIAGTILGAFL